MGQETRKRRKAIKSELLGMTPLGTRSLTLLGVVGAPIEQHFSSPPMGRVNGDFGESS